ALVPALVARPGRPARVHVQPVPAGYRTVAPAGAGRPCAAAAARAAMVLPTRRYSPRSRAAAPATESPAQQSSARCDSWGGVPACADADRSIPRRCRDEPEGRVVAVRPLDGDALLANPGHGRPDGVRQPVSG